MSILQTKIIFLLKFAALAIIASVIFSGTAAAACGGKNQDACAGWKPGPTCNDGLTRYQGKCRDWGQPNRKPWPDKRIGFQCSKNYAPQGNRCKPCGKGDGQPACEFGRIPSGCGNGYINDNGTCRACGRDGQKACPKIEFGYPCFSNTSAPDENGICRPCGKEGQKACRAMKEGRQCELWTTNTNGYCRPCGGEGQQACRITDRGDTCKEGLKRTLSGQCVLSVEEATRRAALAKFDELGTDLIMSVVNLNSDIGENESLQADIADEDGSASGVPDNQACAGDEHRSWTIGLAAGAQVGVGVDGEAGMAFRCSEHGPGKDSKWYSSGALSFGPSIGVDGGVTIGMWMADFNNLRGRSHGYVFDLFDLASKIPALKEALGKVKIKVKGVPVQPSIAIGFWFEKKDDNQNGLDEWLGPYQGFTITVGGSVSEGIGAKYVSAKTNQICDYDMDCALFEWRQVDDEGANKDEYVSGGLRILVKERDEDGIRVDIRENGSWRRNLYFDRDTWSDWRDYKLLGDDDDVLERICFRRNFDEIRYMDRDRNCDRGIRLKNYGPLPAQTASGGGSATRSVAETAKSQAVTSAGASIDGEWIMEAGGAEVRMALRLQDGFLVTTALPGGTPLVYRPKGNGRFEADEGSRIEILAPGIAAWRSRDLSTTYRMRKAG
ncbi:hypothetical protein [Henriciella mobilis]|uniref:Uncharacterized protein n=1 Tax=Henriciella mobilis TaxID=2305467 RepID=A0A399RQ84_9PROT|nr:hypothetical protein [Henriciella mobilis]RIJ32991.1 hypothetical protein D1223_03865 [Henriciella mobilis]